tara:strand:+ start:11173 stop:13542 length:2370 start_codon:yes stop_codon:yes gene_type:complete
MTNLKENKSNLAKLMATENITVLHKKIPTAYFDVKNRILACPTFKDEMSSELYDLFMGHEVGHALYTPYEGLHSTLKKNRTLKGYLNVVEDVRIERKIRERYQGLRKSFYKAYNELMDKDFFGIKERDLQELALIDKINLITKCGSRVDIKLTKEEQAFLDASLKCETWEDVVQVANALYEWSKENEERNELDQQISQMFEITESDDEDYDDEDENEDMNDGYEDDDQEDSQEETEEEGIEGDDDDSMPDLDDEEEGTELLEEKQTGKKGGLGGEFDPTDGARESITEHHAHNNEDQFLDENAVIKTYFDLPNYDEEVDKVLYSYKQVFKDWKIWEDRLTNDETGWQKEANEKAFIYYQSKPKLVLDYLKNKNKKIINHMAKEFEMRQTAMRSLKARTGKSGDLDMNKLAKYQIVDDIFKQVTYLPDGKNHGVNVMLDWSGSISNEVRDLLEQAIILAEFCRRVEIPYRVYLFSDSIKELQLKQEDEYAWRCSSGRLVEMLSNEQSGRDHNKMLLILSALYFNFWSGSVDRWSKQDKVDEFEKVCEVDLTNEWFHRDMFGPRTYNLGGTPLDHTLIAMRKFIAEFNKNYAIEKSILTVITDGYSHGSDFLSEQDQERKDLEIQSGSDSVWRFRDNWERYLKDPYSGKVYKIKGKGGYYDSCDWDRTSNILDWIAQETGVTVTGYFVFSRKGDFVSMVRSLPEFAGRFSHEVDFGKMWRECRKEGVAMNTHGYNKLFLVSNSTLIASTDDELSDELEGAKKGRILSAFKKNQKNKTTSRFLTNEFIKEIA